MADDYKKAFELIVNYRIDLEKDVISVDDFEEYQAIMQKQDRCVWIASDEWYLLKRLSTEYLKDKQLFYEFSGYMIK